MSKTKTPQATAPSTLAQSAMLVNLTIRQWQGRKTDRSATREIHEQHGAAQNAGDYRKRLMGEAGPLKEVQDIAGNANRHHRELTLPWGDDGIRILAASGFYKYQQIMDEDKQAFFKAVLRFIKEYPELQNLARHRLGTLFTVSDYPTQNEMRTKFDFYWKVMNMPVAADFRVSLKDSEARTIKEQIEADTNAALAGAMRDATNRAEAVVSHMVERLKAYKFTSDGLVGKFHDTLVSNVADVADLLPLLNVTGGPQLIDLSKRLKAELTEYTAQDLRDSKALRGEVVKRARDILATVKSIAA